MFICSPDTFGVDMTIMCGGYSGKKCCAEQKKDVVYRSFSFDRLILSQPLPVEIQHTN